jgi:hypothetical protein
MSSQSSFDFQPRRKARRSDPVTSVMAAESVAPYVTRGQMSALQMFWYYRDGQPLDDFQLAELTDTKQSSIGVRRGEFQRMGYIEKAERRPSPSRLTKSVVQSYRITAAGVAFYEANNSTNKAAT